jgi:hypothetical protein
MVDENKENPINNIIELENNKTNKFKTDIKKNCRPDGRRYKV